MATKMSVIQSTCSSELSVQGHWIGYITQATTVTPWTNAHICII